MIIGIASILSARVTSRGESGERGLSISDAKRKKPRRRQQARRRRRERRSQRRGQQLWTQELRVMWLSEDQRIRPTDQNRAKMAKVRQKRVETRTQKVKEKVMELRRRMPKEKVMETAKAKRDRARIQKKELTSHQKMEKKSRHKMEKTNHLRRTEISRQKLSLMLTTFLMIWLGQRIRIL